MRGADFSVIRTYNVVTKRRGFVVTTDRLLFQWDKLNSPKTDLKSHGNFIFVKKKGQ